MVVCFCWRSISAGRSIQDRDQLFFGWEMNLDWSDTLPALNEKIATDGFEFIGVLFMMMLFKGVFSSLAGPVPGYDSPRVSFFSWQLFAHNDKFLISRVQV